MRIGLAVSAVAFAVCAAPALAAPQQTVSASQRVASFEGKLGAGFVYTADVADQVPRCTPGAYDCETTLVKADDFGRLRFQITGGDTYPLPYDIDLHVFRSDASGTQGLLLGEGTSAGAYEVVNIRNAAAGYYLMVVDWFFGAGTYQGLVTFTPPPPE